MIPQIRILGYAMGIDNEVCVLHSLAMDTCEQVQAFRSSLGWTQAQMAQFFGVDKSTVWRWENVKPPRSGVHMSILKRLAEESSNEQA